MGYISGSIHLEWEKISIGHMSARFTRSENRRSTGNMIVLAPSCYVSSLTVAYNGMNAREGRAAT